MTYPTDGLEMIAHCEAEIKSLAAQLYEAQKKLAFAERAFSDARADLETAHINAANTFRELYATFRIVLNNTAIALEDAKEKAS
jgi:hypothetical protein